jgi:2-polyprenyl-3-methyl-5-hydroxy-6-metoxy-1,4-benzoquinol methylase
MGTNVKSYFECHAHNYAGRHIEFYSSIIDHIKGIMVTKNGDAKLLDVGCGDGSFIKCLVGAGIRMNYFGSDLSFRMITLGKKNLTDYNVELFVADAFNIPIKPNLKFDIIHLDSVLHHLIGKTRGKSTDLVKRMIELLVSKLSDNGIIIVEEWYYVSHLLPQFTSFLVFYGLKLINWLNLDLSYTKEIRPGLEVNFLHPKQLLKILGRYGFAYLLNKAPVEIPASYKLFLLKEKGHLTYILKNRY